MQYEIKTLVQNLSNPTKPMDDELEHLLNDGWWILTINVLSNVETHTTFTEDVARIITLQRTRN